LGCRRRLTQPSKEDTMNGLNLLLTVCAAIIAVLLVIYLVQALG
jgi:heme/copper-type cytochrome/quinol oxidase subunit 1